METRLSKHGRHKHYISRSTLHKYTARVKPKAAMVTTVNDDNIECIRRVPNQWMPIAAMLDTLRGCPAVMSVRSVFSVVPNKATALEFYIYSFISYGSLTQNK